MEKSRQETREAASLRSTLAGDGRPGPIEMRVGRRLVRLMDPESEEGRGLLRAGRVELIGPEGERLGRITAADAFRRLRERLERRLADPAADEERAALREGIARLDARAERFGRA